MLDNESKVSATIDEPEPGKNGKARKPGLFEGRLSLSPADIRHNLIVLVLIDCIFAK